MLASASPPPAIFQKAQSVWETRRLPAYVAFDVRIQHRDAAGNVTTRSELPIDDPKYYRLRDVWVDEASYDVRRLSYAMAQRMERPGGLCLSART